LLIKKYEIAKFNKLFLCIPLILFIEIFEIPESISHYYYINYVLFVFSGHISEEVSIAPDVINGLYG
jgi:hypothetical protein